MTGTTLAYGLRQQELWKVGQVKSLLTQQTIDHPLGMPAYYAVLNYTWDSYGRHLDPFDYRKRWDRTEVKKTHRFVTNRLRRCFGADLPAAAHPRYSRSMAAFRFGVDQRPPLPCPGECLPWLPQRCTSGQPAHSGGACCPQALCFFAGCSSDKQSPACSVRCAFGLFGAEQCFPSTLAGIVRQQSIDRRAADQPLWTAEGIA